MGSVHICDQMWSCFLKLTQCQSKSCHMLDVVRPLQVIEHNYCDKNVWLQLHESVILVFNTT